MPDEYDEFKKGDIAEVLCDDGEWRLATRAEVDTLITPGAGVAVWLFPGGGLRHVSQSEARRVDPPPLDDPSALREWLDAPKS